MPSQSNESGSELAEISEDVASLSYVQERIEPLVSEWSSPAELSAQQMDWIDKLPQSLKVHEVLGYDEIMDNLGNCTKRAIVSTATALGNIFIRETVSDLNNTQPEIFSAEHIVVSPIENVDPNTIQSILNEYEFVITVPNAYSDFLYVKPVSTSPDEFVAAYELIKEALS